MNEMNIHLVGLVEVAGYPGGVAEDEHHHNGQQQHSHCHVTPVSRGSHYLRSKRKRIQKTYVHRASVQEAFYDPNSFV